VLGRRYPGIPVYLASCRVQGFEAEREIAEAIDLLDEFPKVDVIIVGRGGGSAEDLWAFNLESVVRAVARCRTPIVSAVGHEIDVSLTDFVADARAPTPSAAAEIVVPELGGLVARLEELEVRLVAGLARGLALARERVRALGLVHPGERLAAVRQRRLELEERLHRAILVALALPRSELASLGGRLHALSPLAVLGRGYALARLEGVLVTDVDSLTKGDRLVLRFARGSAAVVVEETYSNGGTS
jgi:exodeoxyribonuclease VII large subunit